MAAEPRLDTALRLAAYILFYAYVLTLIVAGLWGAIFAAADFDLVVGFDFQQVEGQAMINLFSQYRFLRAIEFAAGVILLVFRNEVFTTRRFNRLFLVVVAAGILARVFSWAVDGTPSTFFIFLIFSELATLVVVYLHTRRAGFTGE